MSVSRKKASVAVAAVSALVLVAASFSPVFAQANSSGSTYTTVAGDTLQSVAQKANMPVEQVFTDTQNQNLTVAAGQTVNAPTASSSTTGQGSTNGSNSGSSATGSSNSGTTNGSSTSGSSNSGTTGNQTGSGSSNSSQGTTSTNKTGSNNQVPVTGNASAGLPVAPALASGQHYIVVFPGEYLSTYAVRYKTTVDNLLSLNPQIKNRALLIDGQVIIVPNAGSAAASNGQVPNTGSTGSNNSSNSGSTGSNNSSNSGSTSGSTGSNTSNSGTTGSNSSSTTGNSNNSNSGSTTGSNNSSNSTNSGSTTGSNASGSTSSTAQTYTTVQGDTLMSVAAKFSATVANLVKANPTLKLDAGQTVTFPAASSNNSGSTTGSNSGSTTGNSNSGSTTGNSGSTTGSSNNGSTTGNTGSNSSSNSTSGNTQVPVTGSSLNFTGNPYYDAYFAQFTSLNSASSFTAIKNADGTFNQCTVTSFHNLFSQPTVNSNGRTSNNQHVYQVKRGESLESVANKVGTTVSTLRDMNCGQLSWDGVIFTGQWLYVP